MKRLDFARDQLWEPLPWMESSSTGDYVEWEEAMEEIQRLRQMLKDVWEDYAEGQYKPNQCDCDPSVGIVGCLACAVREVIAELEGKS